MATHFGVHEAPEQERPGPQLLSQPPIPLSQAKPGLRFSSAIESVVMRALSKEPPKRYSDVIEFARDFCQAVSQPGGQEKQGLGAKLASMFRSKKS